ncbi:hypothetical protein VMCG_10177 [Cytospora schulzeri]|uniref:Uncharacterized protein n=1 Tax=Cytospora schulzeri TaxID=448051 RepID=A0A423VCZ1_9PEZI|nr:hypothetical protein VMCG_10177 [Valsa malicola]
MPSSSKHNAAKVAQTLGTPTPENVTSLPTASTTGTLSNVWTGPETEPEEEDKDALESTTALYHDAIRSSTRQTTVTMNPALSANRNCSVDIYNLPEGTAPSQVLAAIAQHRPVGLIYKFDLLQNTDRPNAGNRGTGLSVARIRFKSPHSASLLFHIGNQTGLGLYIRGTKVGVRFTRVLTYAYMAEGSRVVVFRGPKDIVDRDNLKRIWSDNSLLDQVDKVTPGPAGVDGIQEVEWRFFEFAWGAQVAKCLFDDAYGRRQDLLQTIIAEVATMKELLPAPTNEDIASIVLQVQVQYLQDMVAKLETEVQEMREENTSLREGNSILRLEKDALFRMASTSHTSQATSPLIPEIKSTCLIDLGLEGLPTLAAPKVEETKSRKPKLGSVNIAKDIESEATIQPETKLPDWKESHKLLDTGCKNQLILIEYDEGSPPRNPSRSNDRSITLQQRTLKTIKKVLCNAAEPENQNTSIILTKFPQEPTYTTLFRAIAHIQPGQVKQVHIRANITFITREAAEKFYSAVQDRESRLQTSQFYGVPVSWSSKPVPPEDSKGRTRVLGVEGHPDVVTVASVIGAIRWQNFSPQMESIDLMPPQSFLRHNSWMLGPLQQVMRRFRSA